MASKHRRYDQEVWRNAKRICKLNARQVEMARALGMNPKKLPSLRPSGPALEAPGERVHRILLLQTIRW